MKLSPEQRNDLASLKNHPGYKVLQAIESEARYELGNKLLSVNLDDADELELLKTMQIQQAAREEFLSNVDSHLSEIIGEDA